MPTQISIKCINTMGAPSTKIFHNNHSKYNIYRLMVIAVDDNQ
jgi:hypothetical protein